MKRKRETDESVDDILAKEQHRKPAPVTTATEPPPAPVTASTEQAPDLEREVMRHLPLRKAPRVPLVALCQQLVRDHGPLTIDDMIQEIWGSGTVGTDDARWLKAQLCKWLTAAAKKSGEQFYPKRLRNPARPNTRLHRWGFWAEQQPSDRRYVVHNTAVLTAIAELKVELVTLRQVQSELLQRQNLLKEGIAAMLEKMTWNGEL